VARTGSPRARSPSRSGPRSPPAGLQSCAGARQRPGAACATECARTLPAAAPPRSPSVKVLPQVERVSVPPIVGPQVHCLRGGVRACRCAACPLGTAACGMLRCRKRAAYLQQPHGGIWPLASGTLQSRCRAPPCARPAALASSRAYSRYSSLRALNLGRAVTLVSVS